MTGARDQALVVLRDIWAAREQTVADLPRGHGKTCKNMRHVGFDEVDDDLRAAWRAKLEREGKLGARTVADLLAERRPRAERRSPPPD
jgi:hypothetical protein